MELGKEIKQKKFRSEEQKAAVNLVYTYNWLQGFHHSFFKERNITIQQFNILRILRGQHPNAATIKLIKERMLDKMSDASRIVEKLRLKGYVNRTVSANDKRSVDVEITKKGLALLTKIDESSEELDEIMIHLNKSELKQLNNLLDKLRG